MHKIRELTGEKYYSDCSYYTKWILVFLNVISDTVAILAKFKFNTNSHLGIILFIFNNLNL